MGREGFVVTAGIARNSEHRLGPAAETPSVPARGESFCLNIRVCESKHPGELLWLKNPRVCENKHPKELFCPKTPALLRINTPGSDSTPKFPALVTINTQRNGSVWKPCSGENKHPEEPFG